MRRQSRFLTRAMLVIGFVLLVLPQELPAASHALLIGIGDYSESGVDSLRGPGNDITLMREILKNRFSVPDANIVMLRDSQATHTNVESAFAELAQRVKAGDFVYIHYSGHGSYMEDKTERSGQDETWVTFGARSKKSNGPDDHDVRDKEIRQWLAKLYDRTKEVVFVSDSCHSATVSRGLSSGVRAAPPDPRPITLPLPSIDYSGSMPGIRIGAARDIESAVEIDVDRGGQCLDGSKCQGVFTWYWAQALQQAKPGERWEDIFKRVYTLVTAQPGVSQRPQLEGHGEAVVFGGTFPPVKTTVPVVSVDTTARTIKIAGGVVNGITKGSEYRLFDSEAPDRKDAPLVEITSAGPFESEATIRSGNFKVGDLVVESNHAYPLEPLRLYVSGDFAQDLDKTLVGDIQISLKDLQGFSVTDNKAQADWVVYVLRPRKDADRYVDPYKAGTLPLSFRDQSPEAWVISPQEKLLHEQMRIAFKEREKGIDGLKKNLEKFARATEIKRLEAEGGRASVSVATTAWRADPSCRNDCVYLPKDKVKERPHSKIATYTLSDLAPPLKRGDVLTFGLRNPSEDQKQWYTYVLNISPDSSIRMIFPSRYDNREEALLKPGESRDLRKEGVLVLDSPGAEVIKVITTRDPIDPRLFENPGYFATRGSKMNSLERLLTQAMSNRRGGLERYEVSEWGTSQTEFQVAE